MTEWTLEEHLELKYPQILSMVIFVFLSEPMQLSFF